MSSSPVSPPPDPSSETRPQPRSLSDLFVSFTLLALQGFGGVLAVVQRELVEKKRSIVRLHNGRIVAKCEFAAVTPEAVQLMGVWTDPVLRRRLTDSFVGLNVMRYNTLRMLTSLMRRGTAGPETSLSKLAWPGWHQRLGEIEMDLLGAGSQVVGENYELDPFQRTYLLSRAESIYGGAHQIHLNIVAERLLGLPRDPRPPDAPAA